MPLRSYLAPAIALSLVACHQNPPPTAPAPAPLRVTASPAETAAPLPPSSSAQDPLSRHEYSAEDGHRLTVWSRGAKSCRGLLVLVHGRTWSSRPDFDLQVEGESLSLMSALAKRGLCSYALDLRGYGASPRDASGWLSPERARMDLRGVLRWAHARHPDLAPPVLLGWSMGALVAHATAQHHPDLVSSLVLYGYPRRPGFRAPPPTKATRPPRRATTKAAALSDFITPGSISAAAKEAFATAAVRSDPTKADWHRLQQFDELSPGKIRVPTLLLHGEHDPLAPLENQALLFTQLGHPDRAWVILAGCDHAAHLERCSTRFVEAVDDWVSRTPGEN